MLALRDQRIGGGERPVGWKVAFGAPAAQERLNVSGPLIGFFNDANLLDDGASVNVSGWTKPALEPELAIWLSVDVPAEATRSEAAAAVGGLGVAIEVVDFEPDLTDVEEILAGDVYQRHVLLGPPRYERAGADVSGIVVRVNNNGAVVASTDDPCSYCGDLVQIVQHTAALLSAAGGWLRGGQVIIAGSVTPLLWPNPGDRVTVDVPSLGRLSVSFTDEATASVST